MLVIGTSQCLESPLRRHALTPSCATTECIWRYGRLLPCWPVLAHSVGEPSVWLAAPLGVAFSVMGMQLSATLHREALFSPMSVS